MAHRSHRCRNFSVECRQSGARLTDGSETKLQPLPTPSVDASTSVLWPPNHQMVAVALTASDGFPVRVTRVFQDEPVDERGDGAFQPDAAIDGDAVLLRAERSGRGDGRVYHLLVATGARACENLSWVEVCVAPRPGRLPSHRRMPGPGFVARLATGKGPAQGPVAARSVSTGEAPAFRMVVNPVHELRMPRLPAHRARRTGRGTAFLNRGTPRPI